MRVSHLEVSLYSLPFIEPLRTARGVQTHREGLVVKLSDDSGASGWGEGAPLPGWSTESLLMAQRAIACAGEAVEGAEVPGSAGDIGRFVASLDLPPSSACALDQALLHLAARRAGVAIAGLLSRHARQAVPVSRLIRGAADAAKAGAEGASTVKLKVGGRPIEEDLRRVAEVREVVPHLGLRLDANGAWGEAEAADAIRRLAPFQIECLEDPVLDLAGMARLRGRGIRLAADEPIRTPGDLEALIRLGAADAVVVKPMFIGGISAGYALLTRAADAGLSAVVTTALGSAVERFGALQLAAAAPGEILPCGLDTGWVLARDLAPGPATERGWMPLPLDLETISLISGADRVHDPLAGIGDV